MQASINAFLNAKVKQGCKLEMYCSRVARSQRIPSPALRQKVTYL